MTGLFILMGAPGAISGIRLPRIIYPIDLGSNFGSATSLEDWASDVSFVK